MFLRICIALTMICPAFLYGAQDGVVTQQMLDSIANPPIEWNQALQFDKLQIDAGQIAEDAAPVEFDFEFRNEGDKPLVITKVVTSCDCVTSSFSRQPILPGATGKITVTYKPQGYPGKLLRHVYVYTNASSAHPSARLTIDGELTSTRKYPDYRLTMGDLHLRSTIFRFGDVPRDAVRTERIECVNGGERELHLRATPGGIPEWMSFRTEPERIAPGETAELVVSVDGSLLPADMKGSWEIVFPIDGLDAKPSKRTLRATLEVNEK